MEDLDKRIKEAAAEGAERYDIDTSRYSFGKHIGYLRGFEEGANFILTKFKQKEYESSQSVSGTVEAR